MTCAELEKLIFEGVQRAGLTGEITEEAHWQAVAETLKLPLSEAGGSTASSLQVTALTMSC
jgi:hypothetical protein